MAKPIRHFFLPDAQVRKGVPLKHLTWAGRYIAEKRPDVIVCAGDFADMTSLRMEDEGTLAAEGLRCLDDYRYAQKAMDLFTKPFRKIRSYKPFMVFCMGNHENRNERFVNRHPALDGLISSDQLLYKNFGWKVVKFLQPVCINGVYYAHYFTSGKRGLPCTTARKILTTKHSSCIAGHQQGYDIASGNHIDGRLLKAVIAGSFYLHQEGYLGPQEGKHWNGCLVLNDVRNGEFEEMPLHMNYFERKYG